MLGSVLWSNGISAPRVNGVTSTIEKQRGKERRGTPSHLELAGWLSLHARLYDGSIEPGTSPSSRAVGIRRCIHRAVSIRGPSSLFSLVVDRGKNSGPLYPPSFSSGEAVRLVFFACRQKHHFIIVGGALLMTRLRQRLYIRVVDWCISVVWEV